MKSKPIRDNMIKYVVLVVLFLVWLFAIQGCAVWDMIKPSKGLDVDAEMVIGDKQEEIATGAVVGTRRTTTNTAETITQTYHTINKGKTISDIALMMLMSFLVGWLAMPSTRQMILMLKRIPILKHPKT